MQYMVRGVCTSMCTRHGDFYIYYTRHTRRKAQLEVEAARRSCSFEATANM